MTKEMAKNQNLLPEDTADGDAQGFDVSNLRVNFSNEEAEAEGRSFEPIPTGKYTVCITDWEVKRSQSEKNNGKPYWALTLTVQDGPHEGRKLFWNVMLFEGALYSLSQLAKALDRNDIIETGVVPNGDELVGKPFVVNVKKQADDYRIKEDGWEPSSGDPKPMKNEVKSAMKLDQAKAGSGNTLMP